MASNMLMYGVTNESAQTTLDNMRLASVSIANAFRNLSSYFMRPALGASDLNWNVSTGAIQATATFTVSSTGSMAAEEGTVLNVTLTAVASGADPAAGEFNISATPNTQADSMVLAINAVPALAGLVTAARTGTGVVTITSTVPGLMGNGFEISAGDLSNVAAGAWANGSNGTLVNIRKGL